MNKYYKQDVVIDEEKDMPAVDEHNENNELAQLKKVLPNYFNIDGSFNYSKLKNILDSNDIESSDEGFELKFLGKSYARFQVTEDTETVITPDTKHNSLSENINSNNIYITGDNLDALKHLLSCYSGKIKCIYIDPPYNTGKDDFSYPDDFKYDITSLCSILQISEEEAERILKLKGKSHHSAWLTFMYPRIRLAHELLSNDGVIFISIDDNELPNLRFLCDEIFGESNLISNMIVTSNSSKNNSNHLSEIHEYLLIYGKDKAMSKGLWSVKKQNYDEYLSVVNNLKKKHLSHSEIHKELLDVVKIPRFFDYDHYTYCDERGIYHPADLTASSSKNKYEIRHPVTKKNCAMGTRGWAYSQDEFKRLLQEDRIHFGEDETKIPRLKEYLSENEEQVPKSVIFFDSQASTKWLKDKNLSFPFPKAIEYIKYVLSIYSSKGEIILDFFSGSATTAHAVMQLNAEDDGDRKYILVQLPEPCKNKDALDAGYETIDQLGRDRIKIAAEKIKKDTGADIDYGFKHFILNKLPDNRIEKMKNFNPSEQLILDDFINQYKFNGDNGIDTLLQTWKVQDGYDFLYEPQTIDLGQYDAYYLEGSDANRIYLIQEGITKENIKRLIELIENREYQVNKVILYGYVFTYERLEELKRNLTTMKNTSDIRIIERF